MNVNISMLKDFVKCPQLAHNIHVRKRGLEGRSAKMEVGSLFHEMMERRLMGAGEPRGKENTRGMALPSWTTVSSEARELWEKHRLWLPANAFELDPAWEMVATEKALESEVGLVMLQGRLDAIIKYNGKFWSLQWKTYESDLLGLQEKVRLSYHEVAYQWLAEQNGYTPWGGTILGACQKLPGYRMVENDSGKRERQEVTDAHRIAGLTFHYLARSPETQHAMWQNTGSLLMEMRAVLDGGPIVRRNYDQCFGLPGRAKCQFFNVCHHGEDLLGPPFADLRDRYPK
jgi:hypothetical protein